MEPWALIGWVWAGFATGGIVVGGLVGWRYVRALENLRSVSPEPARPGISYQPASPEGEILSEYSEDTIESGAREIMRLAKDQGLNVPYDEALQQAKAMLAETLPTTR